MIIKCESIWLKIRKSSIFLCTLYFFVRFDCNKRNFILFHKKYNKNLDVYHTIFFFIELQSWVATKYIELKYHHKNKFILFPFFRIKLYLFCIISKILILYFSFLFYFTLLFIFFLREIYKKYWILKIYWIYVSCDILLLSNDDDDILSLALCVFYNRYSLFAYCNKLH